MDVFPDFGGVGGASDLQAVIGALLIFVLIIAVLMLVVCAVTWAIATANGQHAVASKARIGAWTALGAAILSGAAVTWVNWLINLGSTL